jgi:hypothetical protein
MCIEDDIVVEASHLLYVKGFPSFFVVVVFCINIVVIALRLDSLVSRLVELSECTLAITVYLLNIYPNLSVFILFLSVFALTCYYKQKRHVQRLHHGFQSDSGSRCCRGQSCQEMTGCQYSLLNLLHSGYLSFSSF